MARQRTLVIAGAALAALAVTGTALAVTGGTDTGGRNQTTAVRQPEADCVAPTPETIDTGDAAETAAEALRGTGLSVPSGWDVVNVRAERHDDRPVTVIRHQAEDCRLGAPQSSVVIDEAGTVLGFTRLTAPAGDTRLPGDTEAEELALDFLRRVAPGHADGLDVEWVDRHDEIITDSDGDTVTVAGVKVKLHHESGLYTWVIVGPGGDILTYERDIGWDSQRGRRDTQMWLHDAWIAAHDGIGEQPEAPYALAGT